MSLTLCRYCEGIVFVKQLILSNSAASLWVLEVRSICRMFCLAGFVCVCIGTGFLSVAGVCIYVFRDTLGYLFVSSDKVAAMVAKICPIAAAYQLPDGILGTIGGVLRRVHNVK